MQEQMEASEVRKLLSGGYVGPRPAKQPGSKPRGEMNKTESRYAQELELRKRDGEILWWAFEPVTLRLASRTAYTPDFLVMHKDGKLEFVETKGFWRDDARVKIKVAARMFPMFRFSALKVSKGGGWKREEF